VTAHVNRSEPVRDLGEGHRPDLALYKPLYVDLEVLDEHLTPWPIGTAQRKYLDRFELLTERASA